jgi:hypothetical protein
VQDAFAKKVFGVGRDSAGGALASVLRKRSTEGRTPDAVRPTSTANLPVLHDIQDAADDFARCRAIEIIVIPRGGRARSRGQLEEQVVFVHSAPPSFRWDFRHVELGIHEQREFERPTDDQHISFARIAFKVPRR